MPWKVIVICQITELGEENHCTALFLWKLTFTSKSLWVLLIYTVSLCHVFTLVLLAAVLVLSATVLNTNSGKAASARCACSVKQGPEAWTQRWEAGNSWETHGCLAASLDCLLLISEMLNYPAPPFLKVMQKGVFKGWICYFLLLYIFSYKGISVA